VNKNPPAFPTDGAIQHGTDYDGMTLRDWFAGQASAAIVGTISSEEGYERLRRLASSYGFTVSRWIARESYKQADALLAQRENLTP